MVTAITDFARHRPLKHNKELKKAPNHAYVSVGSFLRVFITGEEKNINFEKAVQRNNGNNQQDL